jgi:hypothetical protein
MQAAYASGNAKQVILSYNFDDDYEDDRTLEELPLIHLHGDATRPVCGYVFSRDEYVAQMTTINPWMTVLSQFIRSEPFIIAGTSMDEVDLDFYLAHRTTASARDDKGPSVRIEPNPDEVTRNDCKRHGMLLFAGTTIEFFQYCDSILPHRPTPFELIPQESQKLVPQGWPKADALAFLSDFELVPASERELTSASPFMFGNVPTWQEIASKFDIARPLTSTLIRDIRNRLKPDSNEPKLLLIRESTGTGKTTVLRRCAFELAQSNRVLNCSALGRVETKSTAAIIDLIDDPLVIIVDNFADQVYVFRDLIDALEKKDIVIVGADRSYRFRYITRILSGGSYSIYDDLSLRQIDCDRLITSYVGHGLVGNRQAIKNKPAFISRISSDPIAVACSRILNDFRPLDGIIADTLRDSDMADHRRYYIAALAQHCFRGGIRYDVLSSAVRQTGMREQIRKDHPLPLAYFDRTTSYIVPQNATIAQRMLTLLSEDNRGLLLELFVTLANEIASRVNRKTVQRRTPEARLAGRLFDFDSVVSELLKDSAPDFYAKSQAAWQWNSRYWEQLALMHLADYLASPNSERGREALKQSTQHARHAVSVEHHPLPLTTLGKILLAQMAARSYSMTAAYNEAYDRLTDAITLEKKWSRKALQPYVVLFRGTSDFLARSGRLSKPQIEGISRYAKEAKSLWKRDTELADVLAPIESILTS